MATVIDAFLVTLGMDAKGFQEGIKKAKAGENELENVQRRRDAAEKRRNADQDKAMRKQSDNFRRLRNDALALAAVFTAGVGIKNFITNTIDSAVNLGYLSQNLGQSTERLKAWQLASERAGGTQQGVIAQLKESVDSISALNTGLGPNEGMQWFFRMGGSSRDLKDGNTYLLARSRIIADIFKTDPSRAMLIAQQMGISEDQFNFIKQGPDAIEDLIKAQEKHAAVSAKDAAAALKLKNQFLDLRDSLTLTAQRIVLQLAPAIERLFSKLEAGAQWVADHQEDIARWVDTSIRAISELVRWVDSAADSLGGWKNVLIGLVAIKLGGFVLGLAGVAAQLAAIAGAAPLAGAALGILGKAGAVGAAAVGGYAAGTYAYNNLLSIETQDKIGEVIARTLASFGNDEAAHAVNTAKGKQLYQVSPEYLRDQQMPTTAAASATASAGAPSNPQDKLAGLERKYGLPPGLMDRIWAQESGRGKNMLSKAGAMGHFQFMPATAREYGLANPYDFDQSSDAAARKMRDLLKQYGGDLQMATAAYNFGQGNLARTGLSGVPKETRDYVAKVAAAPRLGSGVARNSTSTSEVNIENLTVTTQARDADGVARGLQPALERYTYANNANAGQTP